MAIVVLGLLGLCAADGVAFADWKIRRSSTDEVERRALVLVTRSSDDTQAARLIRGLRPNQIESLLRMLDQRATASPGNYSAQIAYAQILLVLHRWADAAGRFEKASALSPRMIAPLRGRARALVGGGDPRSAILVLRSALRLAQGADEVASISRELIAGSVAIGDAEAEVEARREWARARPSTKATFDLAVALGRASRQAEAANILARVTDSVVLSRETRCRWRLTEANLRVATGDFEGASGALERARRENPSRDDALRNDIWAMTIDVARRRGSLNDIKAQLAHPRDGVEWIARARISDDEGDLRAAWDALDEAVRRLPRDLDLRRRRIAVARRIGAVNEVVALYLDFVQAAKGEGTGVATAIVEALDGLWTLGRPDKAGELFDRVLADRSGGPAIARVLAEAASRWGDERRAERGWTVVLRHNPGDEAALVALGEARFQRGQRQLALDTWRTLLPRRTPTAGAHARLGAIFADHGLAELALAEARTAISLSPGEARHHRLLATIIEQKVPRSESEAEGAWATVLRLARGPARAAERQEARSRLIALWVRAGAARVETALRELQEAVVRDARDFEALTFLVEAQLRTGRIDAAIATMKAALAPEVGGAVSVSGNDAGTPAAAFDRVGVGDLVFLLVRSLRREQRIDDATAWLEELVRRFPERSADGRMQLLDIALAGHADQRARALAEQVAAEAPGDPRVALRVATAQERMGHFDDAVATYRRLVNTNRDTSAMVALAALLARKGDVDEQRTLLRLALREGLEDEVVADAGRRAINIEEAGGTLAGLAQYLGETVDLAGSAPGGQARRRVLASLVMRLVPPAYRHQGHDPASLATLRRLARQGVRPLLDLVSAPDAEPDLRAIEVLGMLGRPEVVPHLVRMAVFTRSEASTRSVSHGLATTRDELDGVLLVALGRLGGEDARGAIETIAREFRPTLRLVALWALGRVGGRMAVQVAKDEIAHGTGGAAIVACLSLGRAGGSEAATILESVALDPARPESVRAAAIFGMALGRQVVSIPSLVTLIDAGDGAMAVAATNVLAYLRGAGGEDSKAKAGGENVGAADPSFRFDEAVGIVGAQIEPDALLGILAGAVPARK